MSKQPDALRLADGNDECAKAWLDSSDAHKFRKETAAELRRLHEANAELLEDAARYRWLRNPTTDVSLVLDKRTNWVPPDETVPGVGGYWEYEYRAGAELDEAIDAAIAKHGGQ